LLFIELRMKTFPHPNPGLGQSFSKLFDRCL
jgi:hypothetical protein